MIHLTERTFAQPTLALFFGGTGLNCGSAFQTMLETLPEDDRRLVEPYFFDSQEPEIDDHHRARHYCYEDLHRFFSPIYQDFVAGRFPEDLGMNPVVNSCDGCGVTRVFGLASLVSCRDDFVALLRAAVGRLMRRRRSPTQPIQVYLTASSCGGTGAGMIVDAAALVRHFFRREVGEIPRLHLFLLGPEAFFEDGSRNITQGQRQRMQASSYALLKELHHFAQGKPFVSLYRLRDERIEISNASDDDRLFDWVYYLDGRPGRGTAARSVDELAWIVAEAQLHFAVTEVGRKVSEALPNQREERIRIFPGDFVERERRSELDPQLHGRLAGSSRSTFLASFSVRNVRFPAPEIAHLFRSRWVLEAVEKALLRNSVEAAQREEFDRLLGFDGVEVSADGLLAELGLTPAGLDLFVEQHVDAGQALRREPFHRNLPPDRLIAEADELLGQAELLLRELAPGGAGPGSGRAATEESFAVWSRHWEGSLPALGERLHRLAWDGVDGRGVRWLNGFLLHAATVLDQLSKAPRPLTDTAALREVHQRTREQLAAFERRCRSERSRTSFRLRQLAGRLLQSRTVPYRPETVRAGARLTAPLNELVQGLREAALRRTSEELSVRVHRRVAADLQHWRELELAPLMTALDDLRTRAGNRLERAEVRLRSYQGQGARGTWTSHSTTHLVSDELLAALARRVDRNPYSVDESVVGMIGRKGIRFGRDQLSLATLAELHPDAALEVVARRVEADTAKSLAFLDSGWLVEEARDFLVCEAAKVLDAGAAPLVAFDGASLGRELQGCLVVPPELVLPASFSRSLGRMNRLAGRDPLRLSVVSMVYGIPPNALDSMPDLYAQYRLHLGDEARLRSHDRYPLHVFRGAAAKLDEPHSLLDLPFLDGSHPDLIGIGTKLGLIDGHEVRLTVREGSLPLDDPNLLLELCEEILRRAVRSPEVEAMLAGSPGLRPLRRILDQRKHRYARYTRPAQTPPREEGPWSGNGAAPPALGQGDGTGAEAREEG
jgi:hypothetical protein